MRLCELCELCEFCDSFIKQNFWFLFRVFLLLLWNKPLFERFFRNEPLKQINKKLCDLSNKKFLFLWAVLETSSPCFSWNKKLFFYWVHNMFFVFYVCIYCQLSFFTFKSKSKDFNPPQAAKKKPIQIQKIKGNCIIVVYQPASSVPVPIKA